jgi:hypothetical protein
VKIIAPAKNANTVITMPSSVSASMTISNTAAAIRMPAPNAVKNNTCCSEKFLFRAIKAPTKEVPPANVVIASTVRISGASIAVLGSRSDRRTCGGSICMIVVFD